MSMIPCPKCGEKISENSNACIYCGEKIDHVPVEKSPVPFKATPSPLSNTIPNTSTNPETDEVLMYSEYHPFYPFAFFCFAMAAFLLVMCFLTATIAGGSPAWAFEGIEYGYYIFFIFIGLFAIAGFIFANAPSLKITITNHKVVIKGIFTKETVVLVNSISCVSVGIMDRLTIATPAIRISCLLVDDVQKVYHCILDLL